MRVKEKSENKQNLAPNVGGVA